MMMQRDEILRVLKRMDAEHHADGDGGYAFVDSLRAWSQTLDAGGRNTLWDVLIGLIEQPHPTLWGIAVEVLVEEHPEGVENKISSLLKMPNQHNEWRDQLVLALLRLGHKP